VTIFIGRSAPLRRTLAHCTAQSGARVLPFRSGDSSASQSARWV